jgi:flagellar transcriptional activator FlhC
MATKSVAAEAQEIKVAIEMIELGARLQVLEEHTTLSREKLIRLYKEVVGASPPKGMFPFSTDWFLVWQQNIHSSLFFSIYTYLLKNSKARGREALIKSYRLYLEQMPVEEGQEPILSFTRAWTLLRFMDSNMLVMIPCTKCSGKFIKNTYELNNGFICGLCHVPSRAGKKAKKD